MLYLVESTIEMHEYMEETTKRNTFDLAEAESADEAEKKVVEFYEKHNGAFSACYVLSCTAKEPIR